MAPRELQVSVALAALSASVALAFGGLFSSAAYVGPLLGAALLPHLLGWATRRWTRSPGWSALVALGGLVLYSEALVGLGTPSRLIHQASSGLTVVRNDTVPIPATAGAVLLLAVAVWVMASVADDLAFHRDGTVSALAPATMVLVWVRIFSTPHNWLPSTVAFGVSAAAFLTLQHHALNGRRRTQVGRSPGARGWRLLAVAVAGALIATLGGAALAAARPGADHKIIGVGNHTAPSGGSYQATVQPDVHVGDQLQQGANAPVFTVRASQPEYWRQTALDDFSTGDGGEWSLQAHGSGAVGQGLSGVVPNDALHQTFRIGPLGDRWMPAAYDPVRVSRSNTLVVRDSNTLVTGEPSVSGLTYTVQSRVDSAPATPAQQAATAAPVPASLRRFTTLPSDLPGVISATARQITAGQPTPYAKAVALLDYFRSGQFTYDPREVLGDSGNAIVRFLEIRRGFCVQFASAYAVMARSLGIPARLAVGYTPGTRDAGGTFHVTTDDAHAWPEIWLAGLGWTNRFDPTPQVAQPGASTPLPGQPATTPTANHPAVPVPSTAAPAPGTGTGGAGGGASSGTAGGRGGSAARAPSRASVSTSSANPGLSTWAWVLGLVGVLALAALAVGGALVARKARRRARRHGASDPADAVSGAWAEALDGFAAAGVTWPASLTPLEVAAELPARVGAAVDAPLGSLARRYTTVRYSAQVPDSESVEAAWREVDAVQQALDSTLRLSTRLRAQLRVPVVAGQPEPAGWLGWSRRRSSSTKV